MSVNAARGPAFTTERRLPGVYFLPPPDQLAREFPPLDVAGFVGFAERGPLNRPVLIEELDEFAAVFGGEQPLARAPDGQITGSYLLATLRGFFANGGRRCYVVRVAGAGAAHATFHLPGVVRFGGDTLTQTSLTPVAAAWPGTWANDLQLATQLRVQPLPTRVFEIERVDGLRTTLLWDPTGAPEALRPGDVLRLTIHSETNGSRTWLLPIETLETVPERAALHLTGRAVPTYARLPWSPDKAPDVQQVRRLDESGAPPIGVTTQLNGEEGNLKLTFNGAEADTLKAGDILRLRTKKQGCDVEWKSFLFPITQINSQRRGEGDIGWTSEVTGNSLILIDGALEADQLPKLLGDDESLVVERLRFDLLTFDGGRLSEGIPDAAFNSGHPRFWGELALCGSGQRGSLREDDVDLARASRAAAVYRNIQSSERTNRNTFGGEDLDALTGSLAPAAFGEEILLPIGVPATVSGAEAMAGAHLAGHDGLDRFDAALFVDERLTSTGAGALMVEAEHLYYQLNQRLGGLHALTFVDEIGLLGVPDAVHRGWTKLSGVPVTPQDPGSPEQPSPPTGFSDCVDPPALMRVKPAHGQLDGGTDVLICGTGFSATGPTPEVHFGSRAASHVTVISDELLRCVTPEANARGYVDVSVTTSRGRAKLIDGFRYDDESRLPARGLPLIDDLSAYDHQPLVALQRALLDLCQGRGDVLGVLSLPQHFNKREVLAWQASLGAAMTPEDDLSYLAVYHPWIIEPDPFDRRRQRAVPPGGVACGAIAEREQQRGVWIAPANTPLRGVTGLEPDLSQDDAAELYELRVNLLHRQPRDFRAVSAQTLSQVTGWRQISVRRLMILLRKLAFGIGMELVFENNDERLREWLRADLEALLRRMFLLGAFAGRTEAESFRVVTDAQANTPQSVDLGRLIALVQVAPSQPTEFITVELRRVGGESIRTREV